MQASQIQLVIPMAGLGSRFASEGYEKPKPMLDIHGQPMISVVVENLLANEVTKVILVSRSGVASRGELLSLFENAKFELELVELYETTNGPAETVLAARDLLDPEQPLVIANSDQFLNYDMAYFYQRLVDGKSHGLIICMEDTDPKWSFVKLSTDGRVMEVVEKQAVSNLATAGIYGFSSTAYALAAIDEMIRTNTRSAGEFYVGPAYNFMIGSGLDVDYMNIGAVSECMFGLGIPTDYEHFRSLELSIIASKAVKTSPTPPDIRRNR